ncbi:MAG: hypothetical protein AB7V18_14070 [Pyrinomonadaceae bacterium]
METTLPETPVHDITFTVEAEAVSTEEPISLTRYDTSELAFELGAWLVGIRSFSSTCRDMFAGDGRSGPQDLRREFRIVHEGLLKAAAAGTRLSREANRFESVFGGSILEEDVVELLGLIRRATFLGGSLSTAKDLTTAEWNAWDQALENDLIASRPAKKLMSFALSSGSTSLPAPLVKLFNSGSVDVVDRIDLQDIVPKVGTALRFLEIVGQAMRSDEPLKPSLLIFSGVHEQTRHLIEHINNRLARFGNEDAPLFGSLDSASYSASLELKKVFQQELRGIVGILPPPSVFARIETAYSLLLDSFQQILLDLARLVEPKATLFDFFPRFQIKLDQSLILREHLWQILKAVRDAEEKPDKEKVGQLRQELADFVSITIRFLHYKDEETFERFNEEVHAAAEKKDLVPILHRFGAYLETLFGQVSMRAVLADQPFEHGD